MDDFFRNAQDLKKKIKKKYLQYYEQILIRRYYSGFNETPTGFQLWRAKTSGATKVVKASHRSMTKSRVRSSVYSFFTILFKKSSIQGRWHTHFTKEQQQASLTPYCQGRTRSWRQMCRHTTGSEPNSSRSSGFTVIAKAFEQNTRQSEKGVNYTLLKKKKVFFIQLS